VRWVKKETTRLGLTIGQQKTCRNDDSSQPARVHGHLVEILPPYDIVTMLRYQEDRKGFFGGLNPWTWRFRIYLPSTTFYGFACPWFQQY
jgi:hypothetical protein